MLQEKRKDLDSEKRKKLLESLLQEMARDNPDLYYQSTSEIAQLLKARIDRGTALHPEQRELLSGLGPHDIKLLLSLH
ncbi:hypothetical protein [Salipiger sp. PrR003]|uniref:hypothetical protein n=1 Tax=Salipiger sp. PrR003 TaxID=2706776 RepID=UPI0013DC2AEC|nr:hypothetical protein [Salipiger sp. PrR003]NDV51488.1 hypothetical protein [Salipiger sp. PrR003]